MDARQGMEVIRLASATVFLLCLWSSADAQQGGEEHSNSMAGSGNEQDSHPNFHLLNQNHCWEDLRSEDKVKLDPRFPWVAFLQYQTGEDLQFRCEGTLINDRYVLTAAHCVTGIGNTSLVGVHLGKSLLKIHPDCLHIGDMPTCYYRLQKLDFSEVIVHPEYKPEKWDQGNDIALVRLDIAVNITDLAAPICLPAGQSLTDRYENETLYVAGWQKPDADSFHELPWVDIPVMANQECASIYQSQFTLDAKQLCAGEEGYGPTPGCGGCPLMSRESVVGSGPRTRWVLVGIASMGPDIKKEGKPSIFTRVAPYINWILDNLKP